MIRIEHSSQQTGSSEPTVTIYDLAGRLIRELLYPSSYSSGAWCFMWDGRDIFNQKLPAGVYFLELAAGDYIAVEKLLLIR
ncbi:MAG: hypothetical protein JSV53_07130 [candidate division WOR-3 bacterium]|nr:MAG: hypothetical protein JSV53_07130 [candidate division WOR-3 bacterium]